MDHKININEIISVYSGKVNHCRCGCSGKHTYKESTREIASLERGRPVLDEEINDRVVKMIINKLNKNPNTIFEDYSHYSLETKTRLYIAYITSEEQPINPEHIKK